MKTATISLEAYNALIWAAQEFTTGLEYEAFSMEELNPVYDALTEQPIIS